MRLMSKKKPPATGETPESQPDTTNSPATDETPEGQLDNPDATGTTQTPLRVDDPRLFQVIDELRKPLRRSRNLMIILLLEEALTARGLWPPPSSGAPVASH